MAGLFLALDMKGKSAFHVTRLRTCLEHLPGVHHWHRDSPLFCEFEFKGDNTIVNMLEDGNCISIEGTGDASLQVALEIYKCYGVEIHAIDPECTFDILLSTVSSLDDFKDKIRRHVGQEHLSAS